MRPKLIVLLLIVTTVYACAATIYVDDDAPGPIYNGSSWQTAYRFLKDALTDANSDPNIIEIKVALGIYKPDLSEDDPNGTGDRNATFYLVDGVVIKGGYAGLGQSDPNARNIEIYETILSGDLDGNDIDVNDLANLHNEPTRAENSYHVVTGSSADETATMDGFTITAGNATGAPFGGGIYINQGSPAILNCTIKYNTAGEGAGVYTYNSKSTFRNCLFEKNGYYTSFYCAGFGGDVSLVDCNFISNHGGGLNSWQSHTTLNKCSFIGNTEYGALIVDNRDITDCLFLGNEGWFGLGIHASQANVKNCKFINNSSSGLSVSGDGDDSASPVVSNCLFSGNGAEDGRGGGAYIEAYAKPTFVDCVFENNKAREGGAIIIEGEKIGSWPQKSSNASAALISCKFLKNHAVRNGGGICCGTETNEGSAGKAYLTNCLFIGNTAEVSGGAIANVQWVCGASIVNCTVVANSAGQWSGGLYDGRSESTISNSIFWANSDISGNIANAQITGIWPYENLNFSCIQDEDPNDEYIPFEGADYNNIDDYPRFVKMPDDGGDGWGDDPCTPDANEAVNDDYGDLHLLTGSPCIDAGDNDAVSLFHPNEEYEEMDLDRTRRKRDDLFTEDTGNGTPPIVDMGAYEYRLPITKDVVYVRSNANGADDGSCWEDAFVNLQDALRMGGAREIWVAAGTYKPDEGLAITPGDKGASFWLENGTCVYGGFPPQGGDFKHRNPSFYKTTLSGDLDDDNSWTVVNSSYTNENILLNGFLIDSGGYYGTCGGLLNKYGNVNVSNCFFVNNSGAIYSYYSKLVLDTCTLKTNQAGGLNEEVVTNQSSDAVFKNCAFVDNYGTAMKNSNSNPAIINCTFAGNTGLAITNDNYISDGVFYACYPIIKNCIFWSNNSYSSEQIHGESSDVAYSCIQDDNPDDANIPFGGTGKHNIDDDPCFALHGYPKHPFFTWILGDYHLKSEHGRWKSSIYADLDPTYDHFVNLSDFAAFARDWQKAGTYASDFNRDGKVDYTDLSILLDNYIEEYSLGEWVYDDVTSSCIDTGDPNSDWTRELWPHGKSINMGYYGNTPQASLSNSTEGNIADLNNDDIVEVLDLAILANGWLSDDLLTPENINRRGKVDLFDYSIFAENWYWNN